MLQGTKSYYNGKLRILNNLKYEFLSSTKNFEKCSLAFS